VTVPWTIADSAPVLAGLAALIPVLFNKMATLWLALLGAGLFCSVVDVGALLLGRALGEPSQHSFRLSVHIEIHTSWLQR